MSEPRISVIIVSYNRADDLRMCLDSVFSSGYQNLQVIVVDNASKDDSAAVAKAYDAVVLIKCDTNLGFAEGNNVGLRAANGEYIALLNNDLVLEKTWFHTLVHFLESHPEYGAAGGRAYCWDAQNPPFGMTNDYYSIIEIEADTGRAHYRRNNDDPANDVAGLVGCAVLIRREALNSAGPVFLEREFFAYYEELDFFLRLIRTGWKLRYLPQARVWHRGGQTKPTNYFQYYHLQRNFLIYLARNFPRGTFERAVQEFRQKCLRTFLPAPWRILRPGSVKRQALRDVWWWCRKNLARLRRINEESLAENTATPDAIRRSQCGAVENLV